MSMRGLVIREPWIGKILAGQKTWEMRPKGTSVRGEIALIRKGSGMVVGTAKLVDSLPPLMRDNYMSFRDRHAVPPEMLDEVIANHWVHAWVLTDARALPNPVSYRHASGAVIFVVLDDSVTAAIKRQTANVVGEPSEIVWTKAMPVPSKETAMPASAEPTPIRENGSRPPRNGTPVFVFRPQAAQAHGYPTAEGFVVEKGSTAMRNGSPRVKRDSPLRDQLVRSGVLAPAEDDPRLYRFATDHEFSSASAAAGIIKDGNASGPSLWTDVESGQSLKDYLSRQRT